jgi:DNA-binding transcriptional ArsR family regulator
LRLGRLAQRSILRVPVCAQAIERGRPGLHALVVRAVGERWRSAADWVLQRSAEAIIVNPMVQYSTTVDRAFAALADPTRRAVLERLGSGSATVSELAEPFGMSLTGMKKHIRLLEDAQLMTTEKVGRVRRCMLAPYAFEGISTWLQRLDRFAQVVERTKGDR